MAPHYKAAVLTISDTASQPGSSNLDTTGPFISSSLQAFPNSLFHDVQRSIVPDDVEKIRSAVRGWAENGEADIIITSGGTGWTAKDVTVEALTPLITKPLPSLSQALTSYGLTKTHLASLSNPLCGIIASSTRRTLLVALPGSKGGVKDGMAVLAPLLEHALNILGNGPCCDTELEHTHEPRTSEPIPLQSSASSLAALSPALERHHRDSPAPDQHSHSHSHHSHSHDHDHHHHHHPKPNSAVSARQRQSPHALVPLDEAVKMIHKVIGSAGLGVHSHPLNSQLAGHILAEDVLASHPLPLWHSTNVDGYAVHSEDGPGDYPVRVRGSGLPLGRGEIERVNTGGPIPDGADSVIMVEDTELISASPNGEEVSVRILAPGTKKGENVRLPGSDLKEGEKVMQEGDVVGAGGGEIGVLGTVGRREVKVHFKPRVALLSTGSELIDLSISTPVSDFTTPPPLPPRPSDAPAPHSWTGIYDSNRPALKSVIESMGWEVVDLGVVKDETGAHEAAMKKGLELADVVITTGGTSMGEGDLVKPLLEHVFNATIHFGRVAMAPGKPTTFATVPWPLASSSSSSASTAASPTQQQKKVFFALPGNPASALVTFYVFVVPALRALGGWKEEKRGLRKIWVELTHSLPISDRPTYHRCTLEFSPNGLPLATSTGGQRSSRVASVKGAEILVLIEAGKSGIAQKGERREGLLLPGGWGG
ncbi:MoaB/Mog domain-containing protein [Mrakia frigida]|uniref:bifunctional molybdopterin adenylyltransferase MobB/molybdopterin molybdotransferase MoeA family protein n=1 Tax=Mrakia frigida TaxID=29902 RepID=UPI003FCC25B9